MLVPPMAGQLYYPILELNFVERTVETSDGEFFTRNLAHQYPYAYWRADPF